MSPSSAAAATAVALIPLRTGGKSRLSDQFDPDTRAELVLAMLDDVVGALVGAGIDDIRLLCGDAAARAAALDRGLTAIEDPEDAGAQAPDETHARLRAAVDAALSTVGTDRVRLVVAADLPLLSAEDVRTVLAHASEVVIAPTSGGGTGILLLPVGVTFATSYGPGSALAHQSAARAVTPGRSPHVVERDGTAWDLDEPEHIEGLASMLSARSATAAVLRTLRG
jgi:2-phospho-L-lactate/phosphoenolpyruvate guanylyltransferase